MNKTLAEALAFAEALAACAAVDVDPAHPALRHPALHSRAPGQGGACRDRRQGRRAEHALGRRRRLDRRNLAADAEGLRPRPGRARPQRAARAFRRDGPHGRLEDRGGAAPWTGAADLRRRDAGRTRCRSRRGGVARAGAGAPCDFSATRRCAAQILFAYEPVWAIGATAFRRAPTMPTGSKR